MSFYLESQFSKKYSLSLRALRPLIVVLTIEVSSSFSLFLRIFRCHHYHIRLACVGLVILTIIYAPKILSSSTSLNTFVPSSTSYF